jgi:hypothetical protein
VEYDFDSSEARTTTTEYYTNATTDAEFLAAYLRGLRKNVTVTRSGAQEAKVLYTYDGSAVEPAGTPVNLEAVSGKRGNLTREERWLSGAPQNPAVARVYYSTGQVKQETNARGKTTSYEYGCEGSAVSKVGILLVSDHRSPSEPIAILL